MLSQPVSLPCESPVNASLDIILIVVTFLSSTVVLASALLSPFVMLITYSPVDNSAFPLNVTSVLASLYVMSPSCTTSFFVILIIASVGTALSRTAVNVSAAVALKLVIAPSI